MRITSSELVFFATGSQAEDETLIRLINEAVAFDTSSTWMLRKKLRACDKALLLNPNIASEIKRRMKSEERNKVSHCYNLYLVVIKGDSRLRVIRYDLLFLL